MKFYYSVDSKEENPLHRFEYEDHWIYDEDACWSVVNEIAHDHYTRYDGWEMWNKDSKLFIYVWTEYHEYIGKYLVRLESEPSFHSTKVDE